MAVTVESLRELDRSLVERVQAGDQAAFDALYREHHERLYRFCRARISDVGDAEDVTQEAFVRAWRRIDTLQGDRRFYPWLRTIAQNLCVDHGRRQGRTTPVPDPEVGCEGGGQEESVLQAEDLRMLGMALGRLSARNRTALELRERNEWSYERIAEHAGVTVPAVESWLWRARQALRKEFAAIAGEGGALAGMPFLGWAYRRGQRACRRLPAFLAPDLGGVVGGAIAAVAMGTVLAVPGLLGGTSSAAPRRAPQVLVVARSAVDVRAVSDGAHAPPSAPTASPGWLAPGGSGDTTPSAVDAAAGAVQPRVLTYDQEKKRASSSPVYAEIGGVGNIGATPDHVVHSVQAALQAVVPPTSAQAPTSPEGNHLP